jgi:hypothetical protein
MISLIILSCMKPVTVTPKEPVEQIRVSLVKIPQSPIEHSPLSVEQLDKLDPSKEDDKAPRYRLLGKEKTPIPVSPKETEALDGLFTVIPKDQLAQGASVAFVFSSPMRPELPNIAIPNTKWEWTTPNILELQPLRPYIDNEIQLSLDGVMFNDGTALSGSLHQFSISPTPTPTFRPYRESQANGLFMCFNGPISSPWLEENLAWKTDQSQTPVEWVATPNRISADCKSQHYMSIQWPDLKAAQLIYKPTGEIWHRLEEIEFKPSFYCSSDPCTTQSTVSFSVPDGITEEQISFNSKPQWEEQHLQIKGSEVKLSGFKPDGISLVELKFKDQILHYTLDIKEAKTPSDLLSDTRILQPKSGQIKIPIVGEWEVTTYKSDVSEWAPFLEDPSYQPKGAIGESAFYSAVNGVALKVSDPRANHIVTLKSGEQFHSLWLMPEAITVTQIVENNSLLIHIANNETEIEHAALVSEADEIYSNNKGEIRAPLSSKNPRFIRYENIQYPLTPLLKEPKAPLFKEWFVYLNTARVMQTETLRVRGIAPKTKQDIKWSISSNDSIDILSGSSEVGVNNEFDLYIPIPIIFLNGTYQLTLISGDKQKTEYFQVGNRNESHLKIGHRTSDESHLFWVYDQYLGPQTNDTSIVWIVEHLWDGTWETVQEIRSDEIEIENLQIQLSTDVETILRISALDTDGNIRVQERFDLSPSNEEWRIEGLPLGVEVHEIVRLKVERIDKRRDNQDGVWTVRHNQSILCEAPFDEPCFFQPSTIGKYELEITFQSQETRQSISKHSFISFGPQSTEAQAVVDGNKLLLQGRSSEIQVVLYEHIKDKWHRREAHISGAFDAIEISPLSDQIRIFMWDQMGLSVHQITPELVPLRITQNETQLSIHLSNTDSNEGVMLLHHDETTDSEVSLSPVLFPSKGKIQFPISGLPKWGAYEIYAQSLSHQSAAVQIYNNPDLYIYPNLPKQMRLGDKTEGALIFTNDSDETIDLEFILNPSSGLLVSSELKSGASQIQPHQSRTLPVLIDAYGYGQQYLNVKYRSDGEIRTLRIPINVLVSQDDTALTKEYKQRVHNQGVFVRHPMPKETTLVTFETALKPVFALMQSAKSYSERPPNLFNLTEKIWLSNALWDTLSHTRNPYHLPLLDQSIQGLLFPPTREGITDKILWDSAIYSSLLNGVTPKMSLVLNSLEEMPHEIPEDLPKDVQQVLGAMQLMNMAMAKHSIYEGLAPDTSASFSKGVISWKNIEENDDWKGYPIIAQSFILRAAKIDRKRELEYTILQHWDNNRSSLTMPLSQNIQNHFAWSQTANTASVVWALVQSAPKSPLLTSLTELDAQNGIWSLLALAELHNWQAPSANLRPSIWDEEEKKIEGRYHKYKTEPIFYEALTTNNEEWQVDIYGKGQLYYSLTMYSEGTKEKETQRAILSASISSQTEQECTQNHCTFQKSKTYTLQTEIRHLERGVRYRLFVPNASGFNYSPATIKGGQIHSQTTNWLAFTAEQEKVELEFQVHMLFLGQFRLSPFRVYRHPSGDSIAGTASQIWTITLDGKIPEQSSPVP